MLAAREHGTTELGQKLHCKYRDADADLVQETLLKLEDQGFLNDQRFIEMLVRSRIRRGYGPFYIQQELKSKDIDPRSVDSLDEWAEVDWFKEALQLIERKFGLETLSQDHKLWNKAMRFLQRRGFSGHVIHDVLPKMPKA
jgi:regulatory protein